MEFKKLKINDLIPASYNPRKKLKPGDKEFEKIKNSITEFGYVEPVIINKDLTVIGGHQRISVLRELGYDEIDCIVIDIDKTKEKALNIALNKITGEWNKELLVDLIKDLQDSDFDIAFTGFEPPEIEQLFNSVHDKNIEEDDFDIEEELKKPAISKQGDIWLLGKHRLACGDSTLPETYDLLMGDKKANLVVTDPPYNVDYEGEVGKIKNDNLEDEEFYKFLFAAFTNMEKCMERDASIYVFHADTEGLNFRKAFKAAGFYLSGTCIWKKQSLVLGRSPYQWQHEPILYGWKKSGKHNWYSDRKQSTIWEFDRPNKNTLHPTMKPVGLVAYPIQNSSMSNCIVLDPFGGSGSTLIACEQTNRICHTIELDVKYADVIVKRYIEYAGTSDNVYLIRDGIKIEYKDLINEPLLNKEGSFLIN
jgi:DNA modification methylase